MKGDGVMRKRLLAVNRQLLDISLEKLDGKTYRSIAQLRKGGEQHAAYYGSTPNEAICQSVYEIFNHKDVK
jgi:hypothetical protein